MTERDKKAEDAHIAAVNAMGRKIYDDYLERIKDPTFAALDHQAKYEYYMKVHPDFARANPIILRHIASYGMFNELANFLYFKKCFQEPIKNDEDYCDRQADFIMYLYKYTAGENRKLSKDQLKEIWNKTKKLLMDEIETSAAERDRVKKQRENDRAENDRVRRENIKKLAAKLRAADNPIPITRLVPLERSPAPLRESSPTPVLCDQSQAPQTLAQSPPTLSHLDDMD